ncbi:hypothetical protein H6P81_011120 [Aristolochia fimbriata]|uniref:Uncharacterized protein n=1 Tax=Aristolochia fimbriata TaxID=158543 RepID=A0AAV7EQN2_ARIFI|nr:hypothetical protein H6P81_011120 [Aristolochia fimbriata]
MASSTKDVAVDDGVLKVLGEWRVSPPPGSVPTTELRLSYFDLALLGIQVKYIVFFDFPGSTQDFRDVHFPRLRRSLSLALSLFYPLAGRAVPSQGSPNYPGGDHLILYSDGDFVSLTLAESRADFASLVGNQAKEAKAFHPLVPPLPHVITSSVHSTEAEKGRGTPLIAFRVTVFPGSGVSIGFTFNHVVTDGIGCAHFVKSWAAISNAGGGDVSAVKDLPVVDRAVLGDLEPLKRALMENEQRLVASLPESEEEQNQKQQLPGPHSMVVRATFVLKRAHMETLRSKMGPGISSFSVICAFVWACLAKSRPVLSCGPRDQTLYFWLPANYRRRLRPPVPGTYFGNISPVSAVVEASRDELTREAGVAYAAQLIQAAIRRVDEGELEGLPSVGRRLMEVIGSKPRDRRLSVAGTPFFRAYDTDFGWGNPRKIEFSSMEETDSVSLSDSRDEAGGVEIGLGGSEEEVTRFTSFFEEGLKGLCNVSKL